MAALLKILMLVLTIVCVGFSVLTTWSTRDALKSSTRTAADVMRERPGISREEAQRSADAGNAGAGIGAGCCFLGGFGTAGVVWCVGMVPLALLYVVFRPKQPTIVQVQEAPRSHK